MKGIVYLFLLLFKGKVIAKYYKMTGIIFHKEEDYEGNKTYKNTQYYFPKKRVFYANITIYGDDVIINDCIFTGDVTLNDSLVEHCKLTNCNIKSSGLTHLSVSDCNISYIWGLKDKTIHKLDISNEVFFIPDVGKHKRTLQFNGKTVVAGCFRGTIEKLEYQLSKAYPEDNSSDDYISYYSILPLLKEYRRVYNIRYQDGTKTTGDSQAD
jgi:hypothetical protein